MTDQIRQLVATCGNDLRDVRDAALILFGFASGGLRRANLVAVSFEALEFCDSGVIYHLGRSKSDQEGIGRMIGIPWGSDPDTCPVRSLRRLLDEGRMTAGPVFRPINQRGVMAAHALSPASASYIIKLRARLAGLDAEALGAHSLRSGFCTQAALQGTVSDRAFIMKQSGHKSSRSLDPYIRIAGLFKENPAAHLGL